MPGNIKLVEKIGYAMGDTAANIAWRTLTTFLFVFYTDVFGISAAAVGSLLLIVRITDGISDLGMGIIADRTHTKQGKFRPWILWTTIPLGLLLVLTFTTPNFGMTGKLIYAYTTYILLMLVYTANNVPYSALMGVISDDVRVRNDLSSFRFAGAYLGGIIAQGLLIYLVMWLGNGDNVKGYQYSIYLLAFLLVAFLLITYFTTTERVKPLSTKNHSVWRDLKDLFHNDAWGLLLVAGFLFVVYNSVKQGITVIYFKRYLDHEVMASAYMIALLIVSMIAAMVSSFLSNEFGNKRVFIFVLLCSSLLNISLYYTNADSIACVFVLGCLSEFFAGFLPILFFAMLGETADYSEWKTGRRATGLIYSAGTLSMKIGGGVAGAIIGFVLSQSGYDGLSSSTGMESIDAIKSLMSWIPSVVALPGVLAIIIYPLGKKRVDFIEKSLQQRKS